MIKQLKYALMALFLIVGSKLVQTLFVYQTPKKHKAPFQKVKSAENEKIREMNVFEEATPATELGNEGVVEENVLDSADNLDEQIETKTTSAYPTLADLKKNYLSIKNASLQEGRSREDVVIRYYKHEMDQNKVYSLRKLRYYIHEKPATETKGMGSNVIYYGNQVNQEDIQIVAYTLLENGIPLKSIERSKFDWKSNAIEIGTDSLLIGKANLSKEMVRDFSL